MKITRLLMCFSIVYITLACDNIKQIEDSQRESSRETENIEKLKYKYEQSIDSLGGEIDNIKSSKSLLEADKKFLEAQIYSILKESYLDHVIIGTKDLDYSWDFYNRILGFNIKQGRTHKNGIENFFIEFEDSSEIEIISVNTPTDKIAKVYQSLIDQNISGLQFAIRTNNLNKLFGYFTRSNQAYTELVGNDQYSTLSMKNIDEEFPIFFINYAKSNNILANQPNLTEGLNSVWLSSKNIKKTIYKFSDFGFKLIDTIMINKLQNPAFIMKNDNFEILLLEGDKPSVLGVSLKVKNISGIKKRLDDFEITHNEYKNKRGENILLDPETTKSIWIEFNES